MSWEESDQAHFAQWEFMEPALHGAEAIYRIKKRKELVDALAADGLKPVLDAPRAGAGGGGGCCSLM